MTLQAPPADSSARARAEWRRLRERLLSISPRALGRGLLAATVVGAGLWLAIGTWPALLPFAIGGVIAYAVLPIVNALDRVMPRVLASLLGILLVLAVIVAIFAIVLPPLARGVGALVEELPTRGEITAWIADIETSLGEMPGEAGPQLSALLGELVSGLQDALEGSSGGIAEAAPAIVQGIIGAFVAALGLVVLPAWILTAVRDQRRGRDTALTATPAWMRGDTWAVVRIVDRVGANYLRSRVGFGIAVGAAMWLAFSALERLGVGTFREELPVAVFAGAVQVIPEIGPIIGFLPALLILPISLERAVTYLGVYVASRWVAGMVATRTPPGRRTLHPIIMVPAIVALTQFGLIWLFLAGPVLAIGYDLVRYLNGRLSDPPRPAGLIPDEAPPAAAAVVPAQRRVPGSTVVTARG
jgi:predicted PurR-regulated permease PerM